MKQSKKPTTVILDGLVLDISTLNKEQLLKLMPDKTLPLAVYAELRKRYQAILQQEGVANIPLETGFGASMSVVSPGRRIRRGA